MIEAHDLGRGTLREQLEHDIKTKMNEFRNHIEKNDRYYNEKLEATNSRCDTLQE